MRKSTLILISLSLGLVSPRQAIAEFAMSEMVIDFAEDSPRQHDIEIISQDKETQYIATETYVVENPTAPDEVRTPIANPQESGLVITPKKMVLPPGARKMMRFLLLQGVPEQEKIYRIVVKPVIQGVESDKQQKMALKILVGYEALVIVRPKASKVELTATRKGNSITITNSGNTNANLQSGVQCDALGSDCQELGVARIYAGQSWTTSLPLSNGPVKYQVWNGKEMTEMTF